MNGANWRIIGLAFLLIHLDAKSLSKNQVHDAISNSKVDVIEGNMYFVGYVDHIAICFCCF
jgi:hypothetical protein